MRDLLEIFGLFCLAAAACLAVVIMAIVLHPMFWFCMTALYIANKFF